jgi:adenosylmethionine-8-amino-7-oxononanoate aminotransferase
VLGCCGLVVPPEFVRALSELLRKKGVYFYVDECLTYGRTCGMLMCRSTELNLRPDCIVAGKVCWWVRGCVVRNERVRECVRACECKTV